jgi:hypothetical protein
VGHDAVGTGLLIQLLNIVSTPKDARLVLVHAFDPARFAGVPGDPAWPSAMLGAAAIEDLSRVRNLAVLPLIGSDESVGQVLQAKLPDAVIKALPPASDFRQVQNAIAAFFTQG